MNDLDNNVQTNLNLKEALILSSIPLEGAMSQREISKKSGLSLGMINFLIKNLVQKGYVKLSRLNKKNIKYLITKKGLSEQYRLTFLYIQDTFNKLSSYKKWIGELIEEKIKNNSLQFIIIGTNELADIVEIILKNYEHTSYVKIAKAEDITSTNMVVLDCRNNVSLMNTDRSDAKQYINMVEYISKNIRF